jgi:hypothetical protein
MLKTHGATCARERPLALLIIFAGLAAAAVAAMVACESEEPEMGPASTTTVAPSTPKAVPEPEVLSLAPSDSAAAEMDELVLSWKPISGIDRFVLCETVPPRGTECEEQLGASEAIVSVAGPTDDPHATGTWLKYLWLQSCGESECSRPPTQAGAIAHRVVYGVDAWNFIVVVRRLERDQVEVTLANASQGRSDTSTLIARTPGGFEIARCKKVAPGEWCGPFEGTLLSNEIVAEQIYGDVGVTVEFPLMPSTTAPQPTSEPTP